MHESCSAYPAPMCITYLGKSWRRLFNSLALERFLEVRGTITFSKIEIFASDIRLKDV